MTTEPSVPFASFDSAYETGTAPWVIGEPQPAVVRLERDGAIRGAVLDPGCGTGEHTILLAELGYDVLGVDFAPHAVEQARENAQERGAGARFATANALRLPEELGTERYDTVVDSALFHVFGDEDRRAYVDSLHGVCRPGAVVHVLALSDQGPGVGPQISDGVIRDVFDAHPGWQVESITTTTYAGLVPAWRAEELGLQPGERSDAPAWLARIRRV